MPRSEGYVSADYLRRMAELLQAYKQRTYALMALGAGDRVLDAGCGPGMDTVPMAGLVGETGRVVGIDIDEAMLSQADAQARQAGVSHNVEHRLADINALPFDDASFDAVRAERLFQVLPASCPPERVMGELRRVLREGGRIVLADTDWASASVHHPDTALERRLMQFFAATMRPNGYAGRQFLDLLGTAGFEDVAVEAHAFVHRDYAQTPFGDWLVGEAVKAGIASAGEMAAWQTDLSERNREGRFYASVNMVIASGRR
ncbi:MAG: methyltransferase domain-containing protein [Chromatiales bacterium]|jgi:ubiquinone/menaquinone biosynthesis C-methylase UbiE|nr:methyltransferase domain-containing protein [Chromatiales bacterium]MDX9767518.1 methyltransferase domain-containing protein [Ectothiorhodospiraceae bacterium]